MITQRNKNMRAIECFALTLLLLLVCCAIAQQVYEQDPESHIGDNSEQRAPAATSVETVSNQNAENDAEEVKRSDAASITRTINDLSALSQTAESDQVESITDAVQADSVELSLQPDSVESEESSQTMTFRDGTELDASDTSNEDDGVIMNEEEPAESDLTNFPDPFDYSTLDPETVDKVVNANLGIQFYFNILS
jgi:hypothetical protein